jgi:hydrogenase maturation protein HypF
LASRDVRTFVTTSLGRLFDVAAALCGFTREMTFEGQAAMWLEHLSRHDGADAPPYAFPLVDGELDYRPLLRSIVEDRHAGRAAGAIASAFHHAVAEGIAALAALRPTFPVVASGGVFQNRLLCELVRARLGERLWLGTRVPANDGGLCVGQACIAAFAPERD